VESVLSFRNWKTGAGVLVLASFLTSCTVGPKYTKPTVPAAPAYSEPVPSSFTESGGWKPAQPGDANIRGDWWELYGDPKLSTLETQVAAANQTIRAAEASLQ